MSRPTASEASQKIDDESLLIDYLRKVAVAQIGEETGFTGGMRESALITLSEVMGRVIEEIALEGARSAESAGRSSVNFWDIQGAIESVSPAGISIQDVIDFERGSDPLPSIIKFSAMEMGDQKKGLIKLEGDDFEGESISDLLRRQGHGNGNESSQSDHPSIAIGNGGGLDGDSSKTNEKRKKKKKRRRRRARHMRHLGEYMPDYPHTHTYKESRLYFKSTLLKSFPGARQFVFQEENGIENESSQQTTEQLNDAASARKVLVKYPQIFANKKE